MMRVAVVAVADPAMAQTREQQAEWCMDKTNRDFAIGGCTAPIQSGHKTTENLATAFYNRGIAYNGKGQYDRAVADFDQAILLNPSYADAFNGCCLDRAILGELHLALADCNEPMRLRPNDSTTLDIRGFVHLKLYDPERSIVDYAVTLALRPTSASSLYRRGVAYLMQGNRAFGGRDTEAAKRIDPAIATKFRHLGLPGP